MKQVILTVFLFFFLTATAFASLININTADQKTLETLHNIGPAKAAAIISYREAHKFQSIEELTKVKGIGEKTLQKLTKQITVSENN